MAKSTYGAALDDLQASLRGFLKGNGFRVRARGFNRTTSDGLTQVVQFQMGAFDPPDTTYIPGLRENLYGRFTVNLGVYVPEVAKYLNGGEARSFVHDYHCCVRARLGELGVEHVDIWWPLHVDDELVMELSSRLEHDALPFLAKFANRDAILKELRDVSDNVSAGSPPRIVCAIILAGMGQYDEARMLLTAQARYTHNSGHADYVRRLALTLGLGPLNDGKTILANDDELVTDN